MHGQCTGLLSPDRRRHAVGGVYAAFARFADSRRYAPAEITLRRLIWIEVVHIWSDAVWIAAEGALRELLGSLHAAHDSPSRRLVLRQYLTVGLRKPLYTGQDKRPVGGKPFRLKIDVWNEHIRNMQ